MRINGRFIFSLQASKSTLTAHVILYPVFAYKKSMYDGQKRLLFAARAVPESLLPQKQVSLSLFLLLLPLAALSIVQLAAITSKYLHISLKLG